MTEIWLAEGAIAHVGDVSMSSEASPQTDELGSAKRVRAWDDTAITPLYRYVTDTGASGRPVCRRPNLTQM